MNKLFPKPEPEFDAGNNKEYKVEAIIDSAVNVKKAQRHLPGLYYFVFWKSYPEKKSTWEPSFAVIHLWKIISTFHKNHPEKPTATSLPLNSAPPMAKPSIQPVKLFAKRNWGRPTGSTKQAKEWDIEQWGFSFPVLVRLEGFFHQFCELQERCTFRFIFQFCKFLSMSNTSPLCLLFKSSTLPLCSLSMSDILSPVFWFSSSISHWLRRFFIRLVFRFFSLVSHWVRRFFTHYALSSFTFVCLHAQRSLRPKEKTIVILWSSGSISREACQY